MLYIIFFNDDLPATIKTDIKEPHNYMKCSRPSTLTDHHKNTNKWDYYMLINSITTCIVDKKGIKHDEIYYCVNTLVIGANNNDVQSTSHKINNFLDI